MAPAVHPMALDNLRGIRRDVAVNGADLNLLARLKVGADTIEFMGIQPDGLVEIPWSVGRRKELFRSAEKLARNIVGAVAYEMPKQWVVAKPDKTRLNVLQLLDNAAAVRAALETLHAAMKAVTKCLLTSVGHVRNHAGRRSPFLQGDQQWQSI